MCPIYNYSCNDCNHEFDSFRKIATRNEPESEPCPSCAKTGHVQLVIMPVAMTYTTSKLPVNGALRDKLRLIHEKTPGSNIDKSSTITQI